jgi:hypothetical protein
MNTTDEHDEKKNWRQKLLQSAYRAKLDYLSAENWKNDLHVKEAVVQSGLGLPILEHIAAWVWTFRR